MSLEKELELLPASFWELLDIIEWSGIVVNPKSLHAVLLYSRRNLRKLILIDIELPSGFTGTEKVKLDKLQEYKLSTSSGEWLFSSYDREFESLFPFNVEWYLNNYNTERHKSPPRQKIDVKIFKKQPNFTDLQKWLILRWRTGDYSSNLKISNKLISKLIKEGFSLKKLQLYDCALELRYWPTTLPNKLTQIILFRVSSDNLAIDLLLRSQKELRMIMLYQSGSLSPGSIIQNAGLGTLILEDTPILSLPTQEHHRSQPIFKNLKLFRFNCNFGGQEIGIRIFLAVLKLLYETLIRLECWDPAPILSLIHGSFERVEVSVLRDGNWAGMLEIRHLFEKKPRAESNFVITLDFAVSAYTGETSFDIYVEQMSLTDVYKASSQIWNKSSKFYHDAPALKILNEDDTWFLEFIASSNPEFTNGSMGIIELLYHNKSHVSLAQLKRNANCHYSRIKSIRIRDAEIERSDLIQFLDLCLNLEDLSMINVTFSSKPVVKQLEFAKLKRLNSYTLDIFSNGVILPIGFFSFKEFRPLIVFGGEADDREGGFFRWITQVNVKIEIRENGYLYLLINRRSGEIVSELGFIDDILQNISPSFHLRKLEISTSFVLLDTLNVSVNLFPSSISELRLDDIAIDNGTINDVLLRLHNLEKLHLEKIDDVELQSLAGKSLHTLYLSDTKIFNIYNVTTDIQTLSMFGMNICNNNEDTIEESERCKEDNDLVDHFAVAFKSLRRVFVRCCDQLSTVIMKAPNLECVLVLVSDDSNFTGMAFGSHFKRGHQHHLMRKLSGNWNVSVISNVEFNSIINTWFGLENGIATKQEMFAASWQNVFD
jgi:hypothetical protein